MTAKCPIKAEAKRLGEKTYFNGKPCPRGHVARRAVSGGVCIECRKATRMRSYHANDHRRLSREYARKRRTEDPVAERQREVRVSLKSKYGITEADYDALYSNQSGRCGICNTSMISRLDTSRPLYSGPGAPTNELARVDHCHATGVVRGLLCGRCNTAIGQFQDNQEYLLAAVRYLRRYPTKVDLGNRTNNQPSVETQIDKGESEPRERDLYDVAQVDERPQSGHWLH